MNQKPITYYYRGGTERGTGGISPSYRWHDGYSANSADGSTLYPWMTYRECQADARAQGAKAEFVVPRGRIASPVVAPCFHVESGG